MDPQPTKKEVGDILYEQGKLTQAQLETIRTRQTRWRTPQHVAILNLSYASEEDTYRALAELHEIEFYDLSNFQFTDDLKQLVPIAVVLNHQVLPLGRDQDSITLAFIEPPRQTELNNLRLLLNYKIRPVLVTPSCFRAIITRHFGLGAETIQRLREDRELRDAGGEVVFDIPTTDKAQTLDASIGKLVEQIVSEALRLSASDIHIEP
ncbi:MAG: type II/IV secretion system protein, partial [Verrucomicrobiae bacterium]|nr:type II/IV secretion system protein [Verrucomicrobiae bacterium]